MVFWSVHARRPRRDRSRRAGAAAREMPRASAKATRFTLVRRAAGTTSLRSDAERHGAVEERRSLRVAMSILNDAEVPAESAPVVLPSPQRAANACDVRARDATPCSSISPSQRGLPPEESLL